MTEQPLPAQPDPVLEEAKKQTKLLESINGKLGFFVFILVMYVLIAILNFFSSF